MTHPYSTKEYVKSLYKESKIISIQDWDANLISRKIDDHHEDIIGSYPIAIIDRNSNLRNGLMYLKDQGYISLVMVLDDFHRPPLDKLSMEFDIVKAYKTHYVQDYKIGNYLPSKHHAYEIGKARSKVTVKQFSLRQYLDEWINLYDNLKSRHNLTGVHDFSKDHHDILCSLNGIVSIGAFYSGELVSAHIWIKGSKYVFSHLAASSLIGYKLGAAYAVYDESMKVFQNEEKINLGGTSGTDDAVLDGLAKFKIGFTNSTVNSYICCKIFNTDIYNNLSRNNSNTNFFPSYRFKSIEECKGV
jgi:hypothetical protein